MKDKRKSYHRPISPKEYADLLGVNYLTIYRYLKRGEIKYFTLGGKKGIKRKIFIPYEELPDYIREKMDE